MCSCSPLRLLVLVLVSLGAVACAEPADGTGSEVESVAAEVDTDGSPIVQKKDHDGDGFTPREGDCDDANPSVYPGAPEDCDGVVNDCESAGPLLEWGTVKVDEGERFATLMEALEATPEGRVYELCYGVHELSIAIERDLSLIGVADPTSETYARPELRRSEPGTTLRVRGAAVLVQGVVVQAGTGTPSVPGSTQGGSVLVDRGGALTLRSSTVQGGTAGYGGGIAVIRGSLEMAFSSVVGAEASEHGGCLYVMESTASLRSVHLIDCAAAVLGGGLVVRDSEAQVDQLSVSGGTAETGGGVAVFHGGQVWGGYLSLSDNTAQGSGGCVAVLGEGSTLDVETLVTTGCSAGGFGGGLLVSEHGQASLLGVSGSGSVAEEGAGAFVGEGGALTVSGGALRSNRAATFGGGVSVRGGTFSASDLEIRDNEAPGVDPELAGVGSGSAVFGAEGAALSLARVSLVGPSNASQSTLLSLEGSELVASDLTLATDELAVGLSLRAGSFATMERTLYGRSYGRSARPTVLIEDSTCLDSGGSYLASRTIPRRLAEVYEGGALYLHSSVITGHHDPAGPSGGAIAVFEGGVVSMILADLGEGSSDNAPSDVVFYGEGAPGAPAGAPLGSWSGGSSVLAVCSGTSAGCATLP